MADIEELRRQVQIAELKASLMQNPALKADLEGIIKSVDSQRLSPDDAVEAVLKALYDQPVRLKE